MIVGLIGYDSIRKHLAACGYYTAEIREKYYLRIADAYIDIKEQRGQYWLENIMKDRFAVSMFGQKRLSREGGIEIVVKELCTRMARDGCQVTLFSKESICKIGFMVMVVYLDIFPKYTIISYINFAQRCH